MTDDILKRLISLLERIAVAELDGPVTETGPGSLRNLGLTSVRLMEFLVAVEDEFDLIWDDDVEESVIGSLDGMARHIAEETGARTR
ncbi:phosphopantetheine-binding protein [Streptomyces sp. I05A-00742]|uniref:phosphopantetheine-binding protein n=1 Tax=Streptomyces sp. I05A-00742 TaxID=2732853 RepID=UPI00148856E5|nr:phosphopantetheine-binding protein [Streptomyces sp. I05A-00742]